MKGGNPVQAIQEKQIAIYDDGQLFLLNWHDFLKKYRLLKTSIYLLKKYFRENAKENWTEKELNNYYITQMLKNKEI